MGVKVASSEQRGESKAGAAACQSVFVTKEHIDKILNASEIVTTKVGKKSIAVTAILPNEFEETVVVCFPWSKRSDAAARGVAMAKLREQIRDKESYFFHTVRKVQESK